GAAQLRAHGDARIPLAGADSVDVPAAREGAREPDGEMATSTPGGAAVDSNVGAITVRPGLTLTTALTAIWLAGVLLLLARLVIGFGLVRGVAQRAELLEAPAWRALGDRAARRFTVDGVELRTTA